MTRRVLLLSTATTLLVVIAFLAPLLYLVRDVARTRAQAAATIEAQSVAALVGVVREDQLRLSVEDINAGSERRTTVFFGNHQVGAAALRDGAVRAASQQRSAFPVDQDGGWAVLVPASTDNGESAVVRTFVPGALLDLGVDRAWRALLLLALVLLVLAGAVAALLGRSLVKPLLAVAGTADTLREGNLDARARTGNGPPEVRRIAEALNRLADRIDALLQAERESMADVSHRLRTPLTALRLDAEALPNQEDADRLLADVDAVERMVTHVITRTRRPSTTGRSDLAAVVRGRVAFWSVLAEEQGRAVSTDLPDLPVVVPLPDDAVAAAVDALLGNVFAHTGVGVGFAVSVRLDPVPTLLVADTGPGIAEPASLVRGESASSTGLGLDIVRRTAEAAGGAVQLTIAEPHGLCAIVTFGAVTASV